MVATKSSAEQVPLFPGFNLISIPETPADPSPASVFAPIGGVYSEVFAYDNCDPTDPWKRWDPADPAGSDLTALDVTQGLWVASTAQSLLPLDGELPASTDIPLCTGWNLIGYPSAVARSVPNALQSILPQLVRVFGFEKADAADPWAVWSAGVPAWANDLDVLEPGRGYWVLVSADTTLTIENEGASPVARIDAPVDLDVVTGPVGIVGTVESTLLVGWTLDYRAVGDPDWIPMAEGDAPVASAELATFDPTLLLNGLYEIRLEAIDLQNFVFTDVIAVSVEGQRKIGHFTLSFSDMVVPVSGLDLEVIRTYDSRDKQLGDFGVGWTLDIRQGSYKNNRPPGEGWQIVTSEPPNPFPCAGVIETDSHVTTVRLSDREIYRFRPRVRNVIPSVGRCDGDVDFVFVDGPLPGTTLEIVGNDRVFYLNNAINDELLDFDTFQPFEPTDVKLTTRDGRIFYVNLQTGVTRLEDLNGNTVDITPEAIIHSAGLQIEIARDAAGQIESVTDTLGRSVSYTRDASGDLTSVIDRGSNETGFRYDDQHLMLDIVDPLGRIPIRNEYDDDGRLIRHTDSFGKTIEFTHDLDNNREIVVNRLEHSRVLEYGARGNVTFEADELGNPTTRTFDSRDNLLTETDALNRTTTSTYTASNDLASTTDALNNTTSFTYDARGRLLTTTDALNRTTTNVYDGVGNLLSTKDALDNETTYTYDGSGNQLTETDALSHMTSWTYDARGNQLSETDAAGNVSTFTYDSQGSQLSDRRTRTLPAGGSEVLVTSFRYDDLDRLTETTLPDGTITKATYDALGKVVGQTDALDRTTEMRYDELGRLEQTIFHDGTTEGQSYDAEGPLIGRTDRGGRTTTFVYDAAGRLDTTTFPDSTSSSSTYDVAGQLLTTTDARNNTTTFFYDATGRRTSTKDALDQTVTSVFDAVGNLTSVTDASSETTTFTYDQLGRRTGTLLLDGTSTSTTFDALGRRITETDQAGKTTDFAYDALGRLVSVTDALDQMTSYTFDEVGNRLTQGDANGRTTRFEYDRLGRQVARVFPGNARESMAYAADGTLANLTDFSGRTTTFEHDSNGRLTRRAHPDGTEVTWAYTPTGRRASVTDVRGLTSYNYDTRDRLTSKTDPTGHSLGYAYDAAGNRTSMAATVGAATFTTITAYDVLNRPSSITDTSGSYAVDYDANGNQASVAFPNGVTTSHTFDALNRLTQLDTTNSVGTSLQTYAFSLGQAGNRTRIDELDGTARIYAYDGLYRLTEDRVEDAAGDLVYRETFTYDSVGNRLVLEREDAANVVTNTASSYDIRDRLQSRGTDISSAWDANGNLISETEAAASTVYAWDTQDRLTGVVQPDGSSVRTVYDADGIRVATELIDVDGTTVLSRTGYLVDTSGGLSHVVAEIVGGSVQAHYTRVGDQLLGVHRPAAGESRYYHSDGLGSVRLLTDAAGVVADRYSYTAFGELLEHVGSDVQPYHFAGEPFDPKIGWSYNRARWLDLSVGRFVSVDPFGGAVQDSVSLHRYLYANSDPVGVVDPTGEFGLSGVSLSLSGFRIGLTSIAIRVFLQVQYLLLVSPLSLPLITKISNAATLGLGATVLLNQMATALLTNTETPLQKIGGGARSGGAWLERKVGVNLGGNFPRSITGTESPGWAFKRSSGLEG